MKRVLAVAVSILLLCSLLLVGVTKASEPGYEILEAYTTTNIEADGTWTTDEWDDLTLNWLEYVSNGTVTDDRFVYRMCYADPTYYMSWLYDFSDSTDDADDVWQLCIDGYPSEVKTAPDANCTKIEITGHTTLKVYQGDGSGWVENASLAAAIIWADSLTVHDVPFDYEHYCLEIQVDKGQLGAWGSSAPPQGFRVAMYDASNATQGWIAWPPTDPDDPSSWGLISDFSMALPDSLSFGVFVLLSSVAVAVGFYCLRKHPKTESYNSKKLK